MTFSRKNLPMLLNQPNDNELFIEGIDRYLKY